MLKENELLREAEALRESLIADYHWLHRHPETAHHEAGTNRYLRRRLEEMGISYLAPADNITVAVLDSGLPGACVGLRCDTDALPVQETTGLEFASENDGAMHACGHDAHMTIGLAAAQLLKAHMGQWQGRVKIIFQPAEEGEFGADEVIATGLVDDVDVIFAIHMWSAFETGTLHVSPIVACASVDMFTVRIIGQGGHGATPEKCHDALVAGAAVVGQLQSVVSRFLTPAMPAVLTIGSFHAGNVGNIIAQEAEIKGTIRTLSEEERRKAERALETIAKNTAEIYGCTAEIRNLRVSDALKNDEQAAALALQCARELVPEARVGEQQTVMLGDDCANYGCVAPYCYVQVGVGSDEKQSRFAHHSGQFRIDPDVLPVSAAWMSAFAIRAAREWKKQ